MDYSEQNSGEMNIEGGRGNLLKATSKVLAKAKSLKSLKEAAQSTSDQPSVDGKEVSSAKQKMNKVVLQINTANNLKNAAQSKSDQPPVDGKSEVKIEQPTPDASNTASSGVDNGKNRVISRVFKFFKSKDKQDAISADGTKSADGAKPAATDATNPTTDGTNSADAPPSDTMGTNIWKKFTSGMSSVSSKIVDSLRRNPNTGIEEPVDVNTSTSKNVPRDTSYAPNTTQFKVRSSDIVREPSRSDSQPETSNVNTASQVRKPIRPPEPKVRYYNDALDTFTYIIVILIISFFIYIILKDLYNSLKLYYGNIRIPKAKMSMFASKAYDDDNVFDNDDGMY